MDKRLISILFIILLVVSLIPPSSSFIVGPGVVYIVKNGANPDEFYEMDRNIDFNNITVDTDWISFNAIGFNVTGNDQTFINLSQINSDPKHPPTPDYIVTFNISASTGTLVSINLSGLKTQHTYLLENNTVSGLQTITTDSAGTLQWNMSSTLFTTHHTWYYALYSEFGGNYNISVRYENISQKFVNLSNFGPHTLYIYGANFTKELNMQGYLVWGDFTLNLSRGSARHQLTNGYLSFNMSFEPYEMEFRWNNTNNVGKRCYRTLVYEPSAKNNMTFYIITDKYMYDGYYLSDFNNTMVKWKYDFVDNTGTFLNREGLDTYVYIYTYMPNGTRMIIHSEFLDTNKRIYPALIYGKEYSLGISCSVATIDLVGLAPSETDTSRTTSLTVFINSDASSFAFSGVVIDSGRSAGATGLWVRYSDPSATVSSSLLRVYGYENGSLMYTDTATSPTKNFTFAASKHNLNYSVCLLLNASGKCLRVVFIIAGEVEFSWSYSVVNETLTTIFGYTPFRKVKDTSFPGTEIVPWNDVLVFVVFCFLLFSIAGYNAALSGLASGGWFVFAGIMLSGSPTVYVIMGVIIMMMSFLYAWGEKG